MGSEELRIGLIGGVNSSFVTLKKLHQYFPSSLHVFVYKPSEGIEVSGYNDLEVYCRNNSIAFTSYTKINEHADQILELCLDILFVVGISQLVSEKIIKSPQIGCVGYHPTYLPKGRGRAPLAWLVSDFNEKLDYNQGAANFFIIEEEADSGAILVQEPFEILREDTAGDVEKTLLSATEIALDRLLPLIKGGWWDPIEQDHGQATEYGVRKPEDGLIDWRQTAYQIERLVKAAAPPHPGAYTFCSMERIVILNARCESHLQIKGVVGRILKVNASELLVQTGSGLVWVEVDDLSRYNARIGSLLGYKLEQEVYDLKKQVALLEKRIENLI